MSWIARLALRTLLAPAVDVWHGFDRALAGSVRRLALVGFGLLVGWWVHVPIHELSHAVACLVAGGSVSRLEVAPLYGGELLASIFPFVVAGGEYAGRLSGFDTGGSDLVYLATDLGPYLFTIVPFVFLLRKWGGAGRPFGFGFALPWALAPFLSLSGDAYEIGSIIVTAVGPWVGTEARAVVRGDDLLLVLSAAWSEGPRELLLPVGVAFVVGVVWAVVTYLLGAWFAEALGRGPVSAPGRLSRG